MNSVQMSQPHLAPSRLYILENGSHCGKGLQSLDSKDRGGGRSLLPQIAWIQLFINFYNTISPSLQPCVETAELKKIIILLVPGRYQLILIV